MLEAENISFIIALEDREKHKRLDLYLCEKLPDFSRTFIKFLFENDKITADTKISLNKMPAIGLEIQIEIPPPVAMDVLPQNIPLNILFEDEHLIILIKPAGMCTHPAPGNYSDTLVNALLYHCKNLEQIGTKIRPGIVHRLDKGTSGIMVVAKTKPAYEGLVALFSKHDITRKYEAILIPHTQVWARLPLPKAAIHSFIDRDPIHRNRMKASSTTGKTATTHYQFKKVLPDEKLIYAEFELETGRTHQIRVHASQLLNMPVLMDPVYGDPIQQLKKIPAPVSEILKDYPYQLLHAKTLGFIHPITKEELLYNAPPGDIFAEVLKKLSL